MNTYDQNPLPPGSPQWWLNQPVREQKTGARGRPSISFDRIIATALEIVESVGFQAFNMRMLADSLGSGTATLYRHFQSKDEIFAYAADRFLGGLLNDEQDAADLGWQDACALSMSRFYQKLNAHPNIVPLLATQIPLGPNGLELRERVLAMFLKAGFTPPLAASAYTTMAHYVIGFAGQLNPAGQHSHNASAELRGFFQQLESSKYPATVKIAPHLSNISINDEFDFGLKLIIVGLDHALQASKTG
ncbi:TetR/AcrR family transcriptional regulator [Pseudomonas gingeri]|uniref:TetR/AcrR family transcriptional regulator n=1 Tax=Pseudomonas gingeri TaxID=117681 RepID=UPI0015A158D1|nr:TetR/AcrR family transcriptional regulator [Pseudomonas gingeri]NWD67004.1 TetR/AcrR family transcriptional regulator [Pseudomonas gingeri]NWD73692.1 TetR/AcrR family transcriptional regulator [Pseudomonas gingeri]